MKIKLYKFYLIFLLPLILKYLFLVLFVDMYFVEKGEFLEDILFSLSIYAILFTGFFKHGFFINFIYFLYVFYFVLETTSYLAVSSNFSSSYMFLLIDSNTGELYEFVKSYSSVSIVLYIILMVILFLTLRKSRIKTYAKKSLIIGSLLFVFIVGFLKFTGLIENNAYHNIVRGTYGYFDLQNSVKFNPNIKQEDVDILSNNDILVIVLGESTVRGHMGIYGYHRETTPLLNSIKDSLYIYTNVISTDVFTLKVIPKMLSSLDINSENQDLYNIVEIFNSAGYKTFWLSNQRAISYHDNAINKIASKASTFKFYNYKDDIYSNIQDEVVLPDYENALNEVGKKVIFVKLIGSHFEYNRRYPETFNKFTNKQGGSKKERIINEYDNTVFYNDFIVYSLLDKLKALNKKSALVYLSDHGECLYDDGLNFFGRSEEVFTKTMFEIPFLIWTSDTYELPTNFEYKPNRKFMADHFYESIGHLFGVKHKEMDFSKSIFSSNFKERRRLVVNGIDYDKQLLNNNE